MLALGTSKNGSFFSYVTSLGIPLAQVKGC